MICFLFAYLLTLCYWVRNNNIACIYFFVLWVLILDISGLGFEYYKLVVTIRLFFEVVESTIFIVVVVLFLYVKRLMLAQSFLAHLKVSFLIFFLN